MRAQLLGVALMREHGGTLALVDFADCMLSETARQAIRVEAQK